jgi:hypothetical protein
MSGFSDVTGFIADRTAVENRWKLQVEEEMVAVRGYRGRTPNAKSDLILSG